MVRAFFKCAKTVLPERPWCNGVNKTPPLFHFTIAKGGTRTIAHLPISEALSFRSLDRRIYDCKLMRNPLHFDVKSAHMRCGIHPFWCGIFSLRCGIRSLWCGFLSFRCKICSLWCGIRTLRCRSTLSKDIEGEWIHAFGKFNKSSMRNYSGDTLF